MELRPYQKECIEAIPEKGSFLIQMATGLGKTVTFANIPRRGRMLILSHRDELVRQPVKYFAGVSVGVEQASYLSHGEEIVSASVQSLVRRLKNFKPDDFDIVIVDECFPAGTIVDGSPIEEISVGDMVTAYNHNTQQTEKRRVAHIFRKPMPNRMIRINGSLVCTPNHPIYEINSGRYVNADAIRAGDYILLRVQSSDTMGQPVKDKEGQLLQERSCLLLGEMQDGISKAAVLNNNGADKPDTCFCSDEISQSHVQPGNAGEDGNDASPHRTQTTGTGRERERDDKSPISAYGASFKDEPRERVYCKNWGDAPPSEPLPRTLQNRYCDPGPYVGDRSRREEPQLVVHQGEGLEKRDILKVQRVDTVEILQQGNFGESINLCRNGYVYNLEVDGLNNYFANGVLVHNCHHAASPTYRKILGYFKPRLTLGFTATPNRGDGVGLEDIFEDIIFERDLEWGIKNGYLSDIRCIRCDIGYDLRDVSSRLGDYATDELEKAVNVTSANKAIADAYRRYAKGQTLIFAVSVAHAKAIAQEIPESEVVIGGEDRSETLNRFIRGELRCIVNCMVFTEGTDLPNIESVIIARPTKNQSLYCQMVGRGCRLYPGKKYMTLIDCVGASAMNLCAAPSLIGMDASLLDKEDAADDEINIFDIPDEITRVMDTPKYWIRNAQIVDLWAKGKKYNLHGVNWFRTARGEMLLGKPKFRLPAPDKLGRVLWQGHKVPYQRALDEVYKSLCENFEDQRYIWDKTRARKWGEYRASEKQLNMVKRFLPEYDTSEMTKAEAGAILTRLFIGRDLK